MVINITQIAIL